MALPGTLRLFNKARAAGWRCFSLRGGRTSRGRRRCGIWRRAGYKGGKGLSSASGRAEDDVDGGVQERGAEEDCRCRLSDRDERGGPVERSERRSEGRDQCEAAESVLLPSLRFAWRSEGRRVVTSRDDDVAPGQEGGTEVFESSSDDDWRVGHDFQGAAALSEQQGGEVSAKATGAISDGCCRCMERLRRVGCE